VPIERPDPDEVVRALHELHARGLRSLAVVLLHAYRSGELEREVGKLAREAGFEHVALSHEVAAEIGILARGDTSCVDAYLTPLIRDYVRTLLAELPGSRLRIMQSSGGLTEAARFRGPNAILSGPAGGVIAYARIARDQGMERAIGFDMGGTSTDVSRFDGEFERVYETETAGVRIRAPAMAIHTVAAGGGSLCRFEGHRLCVGPESAGADPGPLCYGRPQASELTVTDVNLALGRLAPDRFPFPLDVGRVGQTLDSLSERLRREGHARTPLEVAAGFFEIANANMAEAIRRVSVGRGYDVRDYVLVVFGGAGGQHACALARRLGMRRILLHPLAGVLSAYGMGVADVSWHGERDLGRRALEAGLEPDVAGVFETLERRGMGVLADEGFPSERIGTIRRLDLRYRGTETALSVLVDDGDAEGWRARFEARHERRFGYIRPGHPIEAVVARVEVIGRTEPVQRGHPPPGEGQRPAPTPERYTRMWTGGRVVEDVPVLQREALAAGVRLHGPALILEATGTLALDAGFVLEVSDDGCLLLEDVEGPPAREEVGTRADPVQLEIFNNLFMSIAEQMGTVLRRTALSTNIRERLDFSCAVFDPEGGLVANAPHIPVHLGAMGETVRAVLETFPKPSPGDVFLANDPAAGGSHLPDLTVVTPVHDAGGSLRFFCASRGHHADIGGITPGSMPAFSSTLEEEGVVIPPLRIVRRGRLEQERLLALLRGGRYPARAPHDNLADIEAQIAANHRGQQLLDEIVERYGLATVQAYMQHVQDNAAQRVTEAIERLPDGVHAFEDALDDGTAVRVELRVRGGRMEVDFAGSGPEREGNLNTPRAVTLAAVLYVLRTLVGEPIPLNSGCLRPVAVEIPSGSILAPSPGRA
ncbi:MAG: hydantoinase B/oxoprolinase family protein, partial [Myxococcota bacterium]